MFSIERDYFRFYLIIGIWNLFFCLATVGLPKKGLFQLQLDLQEIGGHLVWVENGDCTRGAQRGSELY